MFIRFERGRWPWSIRPPVSMRSVRSSKVVDEHPAADDFAGRPSPHNGSHRMTYPGEALGLVAPPKPAPHRRVARKAIEPCEPRRYPSGKRDLSPSVTPRAGQGPHRSRRGRRPRQACGTPSCAAPCRAEWGRPLRKAATAFADRLRLRSALEPPAAELRREIEGSHEAPPRRRVLAAVQAQPRPPPARIPPVMASRSGTGCSRENQRRAAQKRPKKCWERTPAHCGKTWLIC